jgi:ABC-2 type transport system ATP-binding protein
MYSSLYWKIRKGSFMAEVINVTDLTKKFGNFVAVDHISFDVYAGEVVGYLGPNGSGKTTTIRMLLGLLTPSGGQARVLGFDAARQSEQVRQLCGYMSQKFALYQELTVSENLAFYAGVYGIRDQARLEQVLHLTGLENHARQRVSSLSTGWKQRLALGTAIVHRPKLLFLDEPTSGVDPTARRAFWDLIYEVVAQGVTALVTTHYMDEAEYCGRVGIMRDGKLLAMDTPSGLKETALSGLAWDIIATPALAALEALEHCACVLRAGLAGDHLRAITPADVTADLLGARLAEAGVGTTLIEPVTPTLEDVFLALAGAGIKK